MSERTPRYGPTLKVPIMESWGSDTEYERSTPQRTVSRQYDYGVWWSWPEVPERWRMTLVSLPREVIIVGANSGKVVKLAELKPPSEDPFTEDDVDRMFEAIIGDWAEQCGREGALAYIARVLANSERTVMREDWK